tara:strand:+ start:70 stop:285 length:216 start_codon:yes stop_codon:yes gene_type:complete
LARISQAQSGFINQKIKRKRLIAKQKEVLVGITEKGLPKNAPAPFDIHRKLKKKLKKKELATMCVNLIKRN